MDKDVLAFFLQATNCSADGDESCTGNGLSSVSPSLSVLTTTSFEDDDDGDDDEDPLVALSVAFLFGGILLTEEVGYGE